MTDTYLLGGHALIDGTLARADIRLREGLVAEIGPALRPAAGALVLEVTGFTMPGLIDAHTHISWAGTAPMPRTLEGVRARAEHNLRRMQRAGVTTIRDVGSLDGVALDASGGPGRHAANQIVCAVGGHGTEAAEQWRGLPSLAMEASGPQGFRAAVRAQVERGAGLIKLTLNAADLEVTPQEARAAVNEAHRLGRRVACHASVPEAIDIAIDVGVDTIEHGNGATPAQLDRMARAGIVLVPTVWIFQRSLALARRADGGSGAAWPPPAEIWQARVDAHRDVIRHAVASGTRVAAGTDAIQGFPPDALADEILALHALGLDPIDALHAATAGGAAALGMPELGRLGEGAPADVVVFDGAPDDVVTRRERPVAVFQRGRRVR
ncbi:imidazolonepropionase-like amidohydrolase [Microcella alkaliphila]|uniref:Imidazolonepropionase-like amidohydrolase n=1 Tax=Microcella alkaliphila TaxID=279828 RepID=A0A4Q7TZP3_9MICO|nr:amidohydrolase family protein [Microcella alkaliphila]RZT66453.1 imidazolonepropionase-like amidohydrolase [Microcella alkaliphila]